MKLITKLFFIVFVLCSVSCSNHSTPLLQGKFTDIHLNVDTLVLCRVTNEWYGSMEEVDKIPVLNNQFSYPLDSIKPGLYALRTSAKDGYGFVKAFLEPAQIDVQIYKDKNDIFKSHTSGSILADKYDKFQATLYKVENRAALDSLDILFYQARDKNDTELMRKIKESSEPYYTQSVENRKEYISKLLEEEKDSAFGLYLYFSYRFQNRTFSTLEEIQKVVDDINAYSIEAKNLSYYFTMTETLARFQKCAVGSSAPSIEGVNQKGEKVSLETFKGNYLLVDFWSSMCHWCRLETPYLLKTYNAFKAKNFTILGVSSDRKKADWLKAIEEDKSYWNQIIMSKEDINRIFDNYCIVGIPHIILLDPDGKIIAKELRGDEIYQTVQKFVK